MRKEADFEVTDRITLYIDNNDNISKVVIDNDEKIKDAVLADHIILGKMAGFTKEWNINGETVIFGVAR